MYLIDCVIADIWKDYDYSARLVFKNDDYITLKVNRYWHYVIRFRSRF